MQRPTGVTILAVLTIIGAVFGILSGLFLGGLFGLGASAIDPNTAALGIGGGIGLLIVSILQLLVGIGLWNLQGWTWLVGVIVTILRVLGDLYGLVTGFNLSIVVGLAISLIILWYFFRPEVRRAFGR